MNQPTQTPQGAEVFFFFFLFKKEMEFILSYDGTTHIIHTMKL